MSYPTKKTQVELHNYAFDVEVLSVPNLDRLLQFHLTWGSFCSGF